MKARPAPPPCRLLMKVVNPSGMSSLFLPTISAMASMTLSVVFCPLPKRPIVETAAMMAGNIACTE